METEKEFKKKVVAEIIRLKQNKLAELRSAQKEQLTDINNDDIDYSDSVESQREQLLAEIGQTSDSVDFLEAEIETLQSLDHALSNNVASLGSLVHTNVGYFLIGAAQETFVLDGKKVTGLSQSTTLFKKMNGLKKKAEFHSGNVEYVILDII